MASHGLDRAPAREIRAVTGDYEGERITFAPGIDYALSADGSALEWLETGKRPDTGSEFLVDYYPKPSADPNSATPLLTDRNVGSVTRTLSEVFCYELARVYAELRMLHLSGFIDTATGASLDLLVALVGIKRFTAGYATGRVTFLRQTRAPADITVPARTVVATRPGPEEQLIRYETTGAVTLRKQRQRVEAAVRALQAGPGGVVTANTLTLMPKPVLGIEQVTNPEATALAGRGETDEELRERAKSVVRGTDTATGEAIQRALAGQPFVRSARLVDRPGGRNGVIQVLLNLGGEKLEDHKDKVLATLNATKAAGVYVDFSETLSLYPHLQIAVTTESQDPSPQQQEQIEQGLKAAFRRYVEELKAGEGVLASQVVALAMGLDGVRKAEITQLSVRSGPSAGAPLLSGKISGENDVILADDETMALDEQGGMTVTVQGRTDEVAGPGKTFDPVWVDVTISVEVLIPELDLERVRVMLLNKLNALLADSLPGETLSYADLRAGLSDAKGRYRITALGCVFLHSRDGIAVDLARALTDGVREREVLELRDFKVLASGESHES